MNEVKKISVKPFISKIKKDIGSNPKAWRTYTAEENLTIQSYDEKRIQSCPEFIKSYELRDDQMDVLIVSEDTIIELEQALYNKLPLPETVKHYKNTYILSDKGEGFCYFDFQGKASISPFGNPLRTLSVTKDKEENNDGISQQEKKESQFAQAIKSLITKNDLPCKLVDAELKKAVLVQAKRKGRLPQAISSLSANNSSGVSSYLFDGSDLVVQLVDANPKSASQLEPLSVLQKDRKIFNQFFGEIYDQVDLPNQKKLFFVEYCPNKDLFSVAQKNREDSVNVKESDSICKKNKELAHRTLDYLLNLIRFLETSNIMISDLKTSNILLGSDGKLKITDYKSLVSSTLLNKNTTLKEFTAICPHTTAEFLPEEMRGYFDLNKPFGNLSQLYAFQIGSILYELATGQARVVVGFDKSLEEQFPLINEIEIADEALAAIIKGLIGFDRKTEHRAAHRGSYFEKLRESHAEVLRIGKSSESLQENHTAMLRMIDQTNAQEISQKIKSTLEGGNIESIADFYDYVSHPFDQNTPEEMPEAFKSYISSGGKITSLNNNRPAAYLFGDSFVVQVHDEYNEAREAVSRSLQKNPDEFNQFFGEIYDSIDIPPQLDKDMDYRGNEPKAKKLIFTEYFPQRDLSSFACKHRLDDDVYMVKENQNLAHKTLKYLLGLLVFLDGHKVAITDLKASNILVDANGNFKITDMKSLISCRLLDESDFLDPAVRVQIGGIFSEEYLPPELLDNSNKVVRSSKENKTPFNLSRVQAYQVACILYQVALGLNQADFKKDQFKHIDKIKEKDAELAAVINHLSALEQEPEQAVEASSHYFKELKRGQTAEQKVLALRRETSKYSRYLEAKLTEISEELEEKGLTKDNLITLASAQKNHSKETLIGETKRLFDEAKAGAKKFDVLPKTIKSYADLLAKRKVVLEIRAKLADPNDTAESKLEQTRELISNKDNQKVLCKMREHKGAKFLLNIINILSLFTLKKLIEGKGESIGFFRRSEGSRFVRRASGVMGEAHQTEENQRPGILSRFSAYFIDIALVLQLILASNFGIM